VPAVDLIEVQRQARVLGVKTASRVLRLRRRRNEQMWEDGKHPQEELRDRNDDLFRRGEKIKGSTSRERIF